MKRKRIAVLVPWLKGMGGVERCVLNLLENSRNDIDIYTFRYDAKNTFEGFKKHKINIIGRRGAYDGFVRKGLNLFYDILLSKINLDKYDVFLISTAGVAELAVFRNKGKFTVALSHTPLRAAHQMQEFYQGKSLLYRILLPVVAYVYRLLERRAWRHIDYAIVQSDEVKRRLLMYDLISPDRIVKITPPVDYRTIRRSNRAEKFFFYGSRFTTYKRQDLAINAFRTSGLSKKGFKLVLGGFTEDKRFVQRLKKLIGNDDSIVLKTNITDGELSSLYRRCYATLFLAINEDTGLVPLESFGYGKPVVAVNEGGPREFVQNGRNGFLVAANPRTIAKAMARLTRKDVYAKLKRGADLSERYTVQRFAEGFDRFIESIK